jgi:hypothetical protein
VDHIDCGAGTDTVPADPQDVIDASCENVTRSGGSGGSSGGGPDRRRRRTAGEGEPGWTATATPRRWSAGIACSIFPGELQRSSRRWAERRFAQIRYWGEPARGCHFAAFEQPELFVEEVRAAFRALRD